MTRVMIACCPFVASPQQAQLLSSKQAFEAIAATDGTNMQCRCHATPARNRQMPWKKPAPMWKALANRWRPEHVRKIRSSKGDSLQCCWWCQDWHSSVEPGKQRKMWRALATRQTLKGTRGTGASDRHSPQVEEGRQLKLSDVQNSAAEQITFFQEWNMLSEQQLKCGYKQHGHTHTHYTHIYIMSTLDW